MKTFINFLLSGFGTDTAAGKALGIAILICLGVLIIAWYIIAWVIRLVKKNKASAAVVND